jgi:hypothetical protein
MPQSPATCYGKPYCEIGDRTTHLSIRPIYLLYALGEDTRLKEPDKVVLTETSGPQEGKLRQSEETCRMSFMNHAPRPIFVRCTDQGDEMGRARGMYWGRAQQAYYVLVIKLQDTDHS